MVTRKQQSDEELSQPEPVAVIPERVYQPVSVAQIKKATETIKSKHNVERRGKANMIQTLAKYKDSTAFVSTGFKEVDGMLGGGVPRGIVIELYGKEGSGKSSLGYYLAAQYSRSGNVSIYIDAESKFSKDRAQFWGADENKFIIVEPDTAEFAMDVCRHYSECSGVIIIVDSVPSLMPKKHVDTYEKKSADDIAGVALRARLINEHIWDIARNCRISGATVIFINQLRDKIGATFGFGETTYTPGGAGLKYAESMRWLLVAKQKLKKSDGIYGIRVGMAMKKNQVSDPFRTCEINLIFDQGFRTIETENADLDAARKRHLQRQKEQLAEYGKVFSAEEIEAMEQMDAWEQDEEAVEA